MIASARTMPNIARQVIDAFVARDYRRAAQIQLQFAVFPSKWMHRGLTATLNTAMRLIGLPVGDLYPPYVSLDTDETQALAEFLKTTVLAKRLIQHAEH
jgi:4-hydroxy-tetrahydrodipicolinate synthase